MDTKTETVADRLRAIAQGGASVDIAQFQFIGLAEVERSYGDRWPAQKARILDIAHTYLAKRLGPADVLVKGGGGFIVVSGSATGLEAQVTAASLSHGLNEFFLGEIREAPTPRIGVETRTVDVKGLTVALGNVEFVAAEPDPPSETTLAGVDWRYQPVWDVRREALGSYYLVPYLRKSQARVPGYQFETAPTRPGFLTALDEASLWVAEQGLRDLFAADGQALVGVAVHASSLTNLDARIRLFAAMEHFDRKLLRYKTIKIANVVPGFPRLYLDEILGVLKQRIPNVVISAAWDEPDIAGLLNAGPVALGFVLPPSVLGPGALVDQTLVLSRIRQAIQLTHAAKKPFFVEGPLTHELAVRLSAIGVDNISSPRIWPTCAAPESVLKWPADRLMEKQTI